MSAEEIAELRAQWALLTEAVDYHARKWYVSDEFGNWRDLPFTELNDNLYELGIGDRPRFAPIYEDGMIIGSKLLPDPEREKVIKQFRYREEEAHARTTDEIRRAQLRFGF